MPARRAMRRKQLIFFQLKHQLSSCQYSGCAAVNSPDLNLFDYKVWSVLQEQVYKVKVNDVDALRKRIQTVWDELDQHIIDKVIKQWGTRLLIRACIEAKGGHFEHKL